MIVGLRRSQTNFATILNRKAVNEMRLIDYDKAWTELVYAHEPYAADLIQMMPTIDPETLPIVRQLREELARVTAERDAVYCLPVKPGDKVYQQNGVDVYELEVKKIIFDCGHIAFDESAIGSSIHLTEEAANAALAKSVKP